MRTIQEDRNVGRIFEHTPDYDRRRQPTLVFLGDDSFHRVRNYPLDWASLSDAALLALRQRR